MDIGNAYIVRTLPNKILYTSSRYRILLKIGTFDMSLMTVSLVRGGKLDFGVEWENLCNQRISSPMCL